MNPLSIISVQSITGSVIVIILLLLVAAVIGFFTAWLYSKSIYTPVVKSLEDEKVELNTQISDLKDDAVKLNSKIGFGFKHILLPNLDLTSKIFIKLYQIVYT